MRALRLPTERLESKTLPAPAAAALPENRAEACRHLGVQLAPEWPHSELLGVLRRQAAASAETARFGVWVMIERDLGTVVGDIGFRRSGEADGEIRRRSGSQLDQG